MTSFTQTRIRPLAAALSLALLALVAIAAPDAKAAFGIKAFTGEVSQANGEAETRAAAHPDAAAVTIGFNSVEEPELGLQVPDGGIVKDIEVELPPGLLGNPTTAAECSQSRLVRQASESFGYGNCPAASQIGVVSITEPAQAIYPIPLYNLEPKPGVPATFGFNLIGSVVLLNAELRSDGDYGVTINVANISQSLSTLETTTTFWGNPSDPAHDPLRLCDSGKAFGCGVASGEAFVTNPSDCSAGPLTTSGRADSWSHPGIYSTAAFNEDVNGVPMAVEDCKDVPFEPKVNIETTSTEAASPTGLDVELTMPQPQNPQGLGAAPLRRATVTLPEGMVVNPSSAAGLEACSPAQVGIGTKAPSACPPGSKLATVEIETPLLEEKVPGAVYLAQQGSNPFGSLLAMYLVAELPERGVAVKLAGRVEADPQSGRLTVGFEDNPQLPFGSLRLRFPGGPRAALMNPPTCGAYSATARMSPWSAVDPENPTPAETVSSTSTISVSTGPGGAPCPSGGFAPQFTAGTSNPLAGSHSPFLLGVSRGDGTQELSTIAATLPDGLLATLKGVPYCPDSALAGISGAEGTAAAQLSSPACPAASQVGTVVVGAGAGSDPFYLETGRAYLAGPYKGAPLSLAIVTPALAGPFDLGNVLVRSALRVDPASAQVTAVSDPLPRILHGIPLDLRDVRLSIDRPQFTLNPTSCDQMAVAATITGSDGATARPSSRFQAASCERLAFKPSLTLRLKGKTSRSSYQQLRAELKAKPGQANIGKAAVTMPHSIFLAQEHIQTVCTRVQFAADACPKGSIYGRARAVTPLLDQPLEGNVYLRANGGERKLPDLVADLRGQIRIELVGYIDSVNGGIRTRFQNVPDAPVSKFVLNMKGGKKSLLVASRNLCQSKSRATVKMDGQNGKVNDFQPALKVSCKAKKR